MAAFGTVVGRPLQGRGGSPGFRFALCAVLAMVIMYLDQRQHYLEQVRYVLQAAVYPIQVAVNSPPTAWRWLRESFRTRESLEKTITELHARQRDLEILSMRYEALARENGELRGLRAALPPVADRWLAAEIISIQLSSLRQRLLIDRGASNGVFRGQAVLDDKGVIGQTTHIGPWSADVILITDPEHAIPVRIERTGLRTIAVGAGDASSLALPYLPANADIKKDDLLVTSGLGGVFPEGYPVARVTEVHRDAVQPLAQVRAAPLAHIDTDTEVMLVWFRSDHPAAPKNASAGVDLRAGNAELQPQSVAPRPRTTEPTATAGPRARTAPKAAAPAPRRAAPSRSAASQAHASAASPSSASEPHASAAAPAGASEPARSEAPPSAAPEPHPAEPQPSTAPEPHGAEPPPGATPQGQPRVQP